MITLENKRLHDLIVQKDIDTNSIRKIARDIDDIDAKILRLEDKEKKITAKVIPPKELTDKGDELIAQLHKLDGEITKIAKQIEDAKLAAIPKEMIAEHKELLALREKCERERNKLALKVQKYKDKMVPILKKEIQPHLGEYEDTETVKAKNGKVIIQTFSYLEDFKKRFRR